MKINFTLNQWGDYEFSPPIILPGGEELAYVCASDFQPGEDIEKYIAYRVAAASKKEAKKEEKEEAATAEKQKRQAAASFFLSLPEGEESKDNKLFVLFSERKDFSADGLLSAIKKEDGKVIATFFSSVTVFGFSKDSLDSLRELDVTSILQEIAKEDRNETR